MRREGREESREEGREEGVAKGRVEGVKSLMAKLSVTAQEALDLLGIPQDEWPHLMPMLDA